MYSSCRSGDERFTAPPPPARSRMFRPRRVSKLTFIPGSDVILRHSTRSQKYIYHGSGVLVNTKSNFLRLGSGEVFIVVVSWNIPACFVKSPLSLSSCIKANFCLLSLRLICRGVQRCLENVDKPPDICVGVVERGGRHPHHGAPATRGLHQG